MPSNREIVLNSALSGAELKEIIRADVERLLTAEGMLSSNAAFGRVSYRLALKLYLDNPFFPQSLTTIDSLPAPLKKVEELPQLAALERPPLPPSDSRYVHGEVLSRDIASPNVERVRLGIPVPVLVEQQDGTKTTEHIQYPKPQPFDPTFEGAVDDVDAEQLRVVDEAEARAKGFNIIEVED